MNPNQSRNSLSDYVNWQKVLRRWPVLLTGAVGAALLAGVYLQSVDPIYESSVRVVIQKIGLGFDGSNSKSYDSEFLSTQAEVISSPATITRSLNRLSYPQPEAKPESEIEIVEDISGNLRVNTLSKTDVVRLTYQHSNPEEAGRRLAALVESYKTHLREVEQSTATQSVELLAERTLELEQQIEAKQRQLAHARASHSDPGVTRETDSPLLRELTRRWVEVQSELLALQTVLDNSTGAESSFGSNRFRSPDVEKLEHDLNEARGELQLVASVYGQSHPEYIARSERFAAMEKQYQNTTSRQREQLLAEQSGLEQEAANLKGLIDSETVRIQDSLRTRTDEEGLLAEIAHLTELRDSTVATLESVKMADRSLANGRSSVFVDVLDPFVVPKEPIWPQPLPVMGIAFLLGGLISLSGLLLFDMFQQVRPFRGGSQGTEDQQAEALLRQIRELQYENSRLRAGDEPRVVESGGVC